MPAFGTWHLADSHLLGLKFVSFENELIAAIKPLQPRLIVMEAPLPSMSQASTNVARLQFGMAAYVEGEAHRACVQIREQTASTARKAVISRGRWTKGMAKDHVLPGARPRAGLYLTITRAMHVCCFATPGWSNKPGCIAADRFRLA